MKTASKRKNAQCTLPYERHQRAKTAAKEALPRSTIEHEIATAVYPSVSSPTPLLLSASSSMSSTSLSSTSSTSSTDDVETARDLYLECLHKIYPKINPRHEYDILTLGSTRIPGTKEEVLAWVDEQMQRDISSFGSRDAFLENVRKMLDQVVSVSGLCIATGRKPRGPQDRAHIRPIPDSKYSIRLFPSNPYNSEYCMDIVDTATKQPVNSPFEFELWVVPNPKAPWLSMPSGCVRSLERNFGVAQDDILPGEEKWLLRDGQTCLLKRPGKRDVQFTVPIRKHLRPAVAHDVDILDFPEEE